MAHRPRAHYTAYVGNVTLRNYRVPGDGDVVWVKGETYNEEQISQMLNSAYKLGRQHALEDIEAAVKDAKR